MPAQYYTNKPNTSQAQLQSTYGAGYNQPGTAAYSNYQQATTPGTTNLSATNPLAVNTGSMLGYIPENYQAANPYLGDYSGMFGDTSMWSGGYTPSTQPQSSSVGAGSAGMVSNKLNISPRIYQYELPVGDNFTPPEGTFGGQYFQRPGSNDPYYLAFSTSPIAGYPSTYLANPGYTSDVFAQRQMDILGALKNYQFIDPTELANIQDPYQGLMDAYDAQQSAFSAAMQSLANAVTQATTPPEEQVAQSTAATAATGLPPGFNALPMPLDYYGYAAAQRQKEQK